MVHIQRASLAEWEAVKQTRLRALAEAPYAFGSTLAREVAFDDQEWQRRVAQGNWFLAWCPGHPVGIVAVITENKAREERHLVAMWVDPARRGSGAAAALVAAICDQACAEGASAVTLWVADGNPRARRFHEKSGFRSTGKRQPLPSAPELDEELMRRPLLPPGC